MTVGHLNLQPWYSLISMLLKKPKKLTLFSTSVEISDIIIEANSNGGEAQLSLQPGYQPVIQRPGPLCSDHGADRPKHSSVADVFGCIHRLLSLNLGSQIVLKAKTSFTEQK